MDYEKMNIATPKQLSYVGAAENRRGIVNFMCVDENVVLRRKLQGLDGLPHLQGSQRRGVLLYYTMLCYAMLCYAMLRRYSTLCYTTYCHTTTRWKKR